MRVHDIVLKCAAFLGQPSGRGFVVDGTCFLAYLTEEEQDFYYLVSCAHVVWPERKDLPRDFVGGPDGDLYVRFNRKGKPPASYPIAREDWIFPRDKWLDICALPIDIRPDGGTPYDEADWAQINLDGLALTQANAKQYDLSLGDEIFMPGAFVGRVGERKNIPVVRIGHIAAMPEEPVDNLAPRAPAYLIEIRSLGGFSGSPVFLNLQPFRGYGGKLFGPVKVIPQQGHGETKEVMLVPYKLLGMMLGGHRGKHAPDFISEDDTDLEIPGDAEFNAGIGVVMPAEQIIKFLKDNSDLKETRTAALKVKKEDSRTVPTSAKSAPST